VQNIYLVRADGIVFLGAQFTLIFQIVIFSAPSFFGSFSIAVCFCINVTKVRTSTIDISYCGYISLLEKWF
jgi:hypothetical protein